MTRSSHLRRTLSFLLLTSAALLSCQSALAAPAGPELQKRVRSATFEVVLKRPETDLLKYEKALPLELIPYTERTDKYQSIGTAFTISPGVYVSAGHVMISGIGSLFGAPAIRDASGKVFPVDRVLKYSYHEDFMVFTVAEGLTSQPLEVSASPSIDESVYSVGNALGEGVVIRDGLLTSMTPEDQDGRWKWLRFSAAASPGNSGGPLLNAQGQVVGVVIARSPGENLNYALPIERVQMGSSDAATYDTRQSFGMVVFNDTQVSALKASFKLPATYAEFSRQHRNQFLQFFKKENARFLADQAASTFPKGASSRLLAAFEQPDAPALVTQDKDNSWKTDDGERSEFGELPGEGSIEFRQVEGVSMFSLKRGDHAKDDAFYADSRIFMDTLLKGSKQTRQVGSQAVRITSTGAAATESLFVDPVGRRWQIRTWPLGYMDATVVIAALSVPDGYAGILRYSPAGTVDVTIEEILTLTRFFQIPLSGSLPQWQAYLSRKNLRAAAFDNVKIEHLASDDVIFESPRFRAALPAALLHVGGESSLRIGMTFASAGGKLTWEPASLRLMVDADGETFVSLARQPKPAPDAGRELLQRWDRMLKRDDHFDGSLAHDENFEAMSVRISIGKDAGVSGALNANSNVLYEATYRTVDRLLPREMEARRKLLVDGVKILEQ